MTQGYHPGRHQLEPGDFLWFDRWGGSFLSAKGDTTIFGRRLRWWIFDMGWVVETIVDSLGMVEYSEGSDVGWTNWVLRGAIIDGIKYGTVSSVIGPQSGEDRPGEFLLEQNYPNPFNPATTIRYGVPVRSRVRLVVYNTLGQQVAELVNGEIDAGYQEAKFDASRLASGVYYCRLQADRYTLTRAMLLVR